jgi:hypothetical protein
VVVDGIVVVVVDKRGGAGAVDVSCCLASTLVTTATSETRVVRAMRSAVTRRNARESPHLFIPTV